MFYDVTVKIVSQKGHCTAGHKVGEEWVVGPHTPAGICVSAFNSLIPTIRVLRYNGFYGSSPVKSFQANAFGLYDMAGNVWEWCSDWYHSDYYKTVKDGELNPKGPAKSYDPQEPTVPKKVVRGGSFLCNDSYCSGYRVAARMKTSADTGLSHTGFRCVADEGTH